MTTRFASRGVGPCRVRLASLAGLGELQLFLTDEEQFANLRVWKNLLRTCREKLWDGEIEGQWVQVWRCAVEAPPHNLPSAQSFLFGPNMIPKSS